MEWPSGIVTFLFTDIVGSTSRWDEARAEMESAMVIHDEIVSQAIEDHNGRAVKKTGDGFMSAFADPVDAVSAALDAQALLGAAEWDTAVNLITVRMGIHTGPGTPIDGDYLGPSVNRAARIEAAGHGGQVLASAATRELVADRAQGVSFHNLGQHHLRGFSKSEGIYQVDSTSHRDEFPPLRTESTPSNLPARLESFVGRQDEIARLQALLEANRLVTIIGPGGAGKTSIAVEVARTLAAGFPGGVWLFELASITEGTLIPTEMLGSMSRPARADSDPIDTLVSSLAAEQALLVIDNCEHLLSEVAGIVTSVLRSATLVKIVATSREALGVAGEQTWIIPAMGQPPSVDLDVVVASDAGALFIERAKSADDTFAVDEDNAAIIADICQRLDGLPFAIELAAARIRSMSLFEIDRRLDDRFKLLRRGSRRALSHHQTLYESVAWSYELLPEESQALHRRLSVFVGGFDLDAAESVMNDEDVLDGLDDLVAQSLLVADRGDPTRYRMLETIRQYGLEQLEDTNELVAARLAHLEWLMALVREGGRELEGRDQVKWLKRFRLEVDNLRAALGWAQEHDPIAGATIVAAASRFFWMYASEGDSTSMHDSTSFLREGHQWATTMLEAAGDELPTKLRARLQMAIGGLLCIRTGRFEEALVRLDDAAMIFEATGDTRNLGWATFYRGCAGVGLVSLDETITTFERSTALHTEAEDMFGIIVGRLLIGFYQSGRDPDLARSHSDWVYETTRGLGIPALAAHGADGSAQGDALFGEVSEDSRRRSAEALTTFRDIRNYACLCHTLFGAASVLAADGDIESAARAYGLTDAIRERLSMVLAPYERRDWMIAEIAGDAFEGPVWQAARAEGATFEPDEGIDWVIGKLGFDADLMEQSHS